MAGSFISFTDGVGAAQLDNGKTAIAAGVGSRFSGWAPFTNPIGPEENALGTGALYRFAFRTDYGASFELRDIPNSNLAIALRLIRHLLGGGTVSVTTGDTSGNVYGTCGLAPGAKPSLTMENATEQTFRLQLSLINLGAAADMICLY